MTWLLILIVFRGGDGVAVTALPWPYEARAQCMLAGQAFVSNRDGMRSFACVPAPEGS